MVEAGRLEIVGTIDTSNIAQGLQSMRQGLNDAKSSARSAFGDMKNLGETIKSIGSGMLKVGGIIGGAMLGMAAFSPAVAPAMARIKTEFSAMGRVIGEEFQPLFDAAADKFSEFTNWLSSEEGRGVLKDIASVAKSVGDAFWDIGKAIGSVAKDVKISIDATFGEGSAVDILKALAPGVAAGLLTYAITKNVPLSIGIGGGTALVTNAGKETNVGTVAANIGGGAATGYALSGVLGMGGLAATGVGALAGVFGSIYNYIDNKWPDLLEKIPFAKFQTKGFEEYMNREQQVKSSLQYSSTG